MSNVTLTMAEWAASSTYEDLPSEVVTEAKRFFMDSVGCALGGAQQHDVHIARDVLTEIAGKFSALAEGIATPSDVERFRKTINQMEKYDDVRDFMAQLTVGD